MTIMNATSQIQQGTSSPTPDALLPTRLSTAELYDAVDAMKPKVAVFDCDGTLWSGDAGSSFMQWTIETGLVSREMADWIDGRYRGYHRGEVSELAICGEMVQMYQGLRVEEMRRAAAEFFRARMERNLFPEMQALVESLQAKRVEIWAVSSTNDWVIEEGMKRFAIPASRVLAARVKTVDGTVTETLIDVPTDGGKVTALQTAGVDDA